MAGTYRDLQGFGRGCFWLREASRLGKNQLYSGRRAPQRHCTPRSNKSANVLAASGPIAQRVGCLVAQKQYKAKSLERNNPTKRHNTSSFRPCSRFMSASRCPCPYTYRLGLEGLTSAFPLHPFAVAIVLDSSLQTP